MKKFPFPTFSEIVLLPFTAGRAFYEHRLNSSPPYIHLETGDLKRVALGTTFYVVIVVPGLVLGSPLIAAHYTEKAYQRWRRGKKEEWGMLMMTMRRRAKKIMGWGETEGDRREREEIRRRREPVGTFRVLGLRGPGGEKFVPCGENDEGARVRVGEGGDGVVGEEKGGEGEGDEEEEEEVEEIYHERIVLSGSTVAGSIDEEGGKKSYIGLEISAIL